MLRVELFFLVWIIGTLVFFPLVCCPVCFINFLVLDAMCDGGSMRIELGMPSG